MAVQLRHSWNVDIWDQLGPLLAGQAPEDEPLSISMAPRQRQIRLSRTRVEQLVADYRTGQSVKALARRYGIDVKTATKHLTDGGVQIRPNKAVLTADELPTLLQLKAEGWNNAQIARHYGCSRQAVQHALRRAVKVVPEDVE